MKNDISGADEPSGVLKFIHKLQAEHGFQYRCFAVIHNRPKDQNDVNLRDIKDASGNVTYSVAHGLLFLNGNLLFRP